MAQFSVLGGLRSKNDMMKYRLRPNKIKGFKFKHRMLNEIWNQFADIIEKKSIMKIANCIITATAETDI